MISNSTRDAYSEVDDFIECLDYCQQNKIPYNIRRYLKKERNLNYHKVIDINKEIKEQNFKNEALAIIAMLNLKYWCEDEAKKKRLIEIYSKNEEKYQKELSEKYSVEKLFQNSKMINRTETNSLIKVKKDSFFIRIKNIMMKKFNK